MYQNKNTKEFAKEIRISILEALKDLGFGHIGGAMSAADVLAVLYGKAMNIEPDNPIWEERDYFVMSKGHAGPALYATLALSGYFPVEELKTINTNGTRLPSHCDRNKTPDIDMSTGALGQGMSTAESLMAIRFSVKIIIHICWLETANVMKVRSGKVHCMHRSISRII